MYDSDANIIGIEPNPFWEFVHGRGLRGHSGIDGKDGADGKDGKDGAIGPQGPQGPKGDPGSIEGQLSVEVGVQTSDSAFVTSHLENNTLHLEFGLPKGLDGKDGSDGKDGVTPIFKIENGDWYISYDDGST